MELETQLDLATAGNGVQKAQAPEISVIVPTFNERENVPELVRRLETCLQGMSWEVIFVDDDSKDGTAERVREVSRLNPHVRCVQRIGRRGLSSACIEGMLASSAPYLAVMDGDCQHDETILPLMFKALKAGEADLVVGSRYTAGGGIGEWGAARARMSRFATHLSRTVVRHDISDPMSGFFALRRDVLELAVRRLSGMGFKILLDLMASSPKPLRVKEIAYEFRNRRAGVSKLDSQAMWGYLMLLTDKLIGHVVPVRFVAFALVGTVGMVVHFAVLASLFRGLSYPFTLSQGLAALVAMTSNFGLNNALTFRDLRLRGWRWLRGLASFILVCSLGTLANIGLASYLFTRQRVWVLAALAGIVVGSVWNYAVTGSLTWRKEGA